MSRGPSTDPRPEPGAPAHPGGPAGPGAALEPAGSAEPGGPEERGIVVALDGPASSGKSSVGAAAAQRLGYRFCDTGLLYRAVTWLALQRAVDPERADRLVGLVREVDLIPDEQGRLAHVSVDGVDVTAEVRGPAVDRAVSAVSGVAPLREALLARQREIAAPGRIIVAGRDIGTVVLPDADLKLFLSASAEERARRRAEERGVDPEGAEGRAILEELRRRDVLDSTRAVAPLRPADDARILVTDGNRFEDTVALVVEAIREREADRARRATADASEHGDRSRQRPPGGRSGAVRAAGVARDDATPPPGPPPLEGHLTPLIRVVAWGSRLIASALTRVGIEGDIDAIPRTGPVILAANHASNADPVIIGAWLTPRLGRRIHWLGKKEMFDWPVIGWMARNGGVHPVDRATADVEAFRLARRILDEGHVLMVFPEGTRSPDGALQPAKDGVAMLALRTGAPVVPIAVVDSDRRWPRGRALPRPGGRVTMRIGRPFVLRDEVGDRARGRAGKGEATRRLMASIAALLPPRQRGAYAAPEAAPEAVREAATGEA